MEFLKKLPSEIQNLDVQKLKSFVPTLQQFQKFLIEFNFAQTPIPTRYFLIDVCVPVLGMLSIGVGIYLFFHFFLRKLNEQLAILQRSGQFQLADNKWSSLLPLFPKNLMKLAAILHFLSLFFGSILLMFGMIWMNFIVDSKILETYMMPKGAAQAKNSNTSSLIDKLLYFCAPTSSDIWINKEKTFYIWLIYFMYLIQLMDFIVENIFYFLGSKVMSFTSLLQKSQKKEETSENATENSAAEKKPAAPAPTNDARKAKKFAYVMAVKNFNRWCLYYNFFGKRVMNLIIWWVAFKYHSQPAIIIFIFEGLHMFFLNSLRILYTLVSFCFSGLNKGHNFYFYYNELTHWTQFVFSFLEFAVMLAMMLIINNIDAGSLPSQFKFSFLEYNKCGWKNNLSAKALTPFYAVWGLKFLFVLVDVFRTSSLRRKITNAQKLDTKKKQ